MSEGRARLAELAGHALQRGRGLLDRGREAVTSRGSRAGGPSPRSPAASSRGRILPADQGPVGLLGVDHVEWYVGNATHTAAWLGRLGFKLVARQGPDTGVQDLVSLLMAAGDIRLLLSTGLTPNHDATRAVRARGDAVHDVALAVDDVEAAYGRILHGGVEPDHLPVELRGSGGDDVASLVPVTTTDEVLHTLIARDGAGPPGGPAFAPGFVAASSTAAAVDPQAAPTRLSAVTTVVAPGRLDATVRQYCALFRLVEVSRAEGDDVIVSVLADPETVSSRGEVPVIAPDAVRFVFASPAPRRDRSHLDDFLFRHGGSGVRTLTFATGDLDATVKAWQQAGVEFLADGDFVTDGGLGDEASDTDGAHPVRRAASVPIQPRTPLVLAVEEAPQGVADPGRLALADEAGLATHRRAHPPVPPMGTWSGGR